MKRRARNKQLNRHEKGARSPAQRSVNGCCREEIQVKGRDRTRRQHEGNSDCACWMHWPGVAVVLEDSRSMVAETHGTLPMTR